jgi:hypothetical protein
MPPTMDTLAQAMARRRRRRYDPETQFGMPRRPHFINFPRGVGGQGPSGRFVKGSTAYDKNARKRRLPT